MQSFVGWLGFYWEVKCTCSPQQWENIRHLSSKKIAGLYGIIFLAFSLEEKLNWKKNLAWSWKYIFWIPKTKDQWYLAVCKGLFYYSSLHLYFTKKFCKSYDWKKNDTNTTTKNTNKNTNSGQWHRKKKNTNTISNEKQKQSKKHKID